MTKGGSSEECKVQREGGEGGGRRYRDRVRVTDIQRLETRNQVIWVPLVATGEAHDLQRLERTFKVPQQKPKFS